MNNAAEKREGSTMSMMPLTRMKMNEWMQNVESETMLLLTYHYH